MSGCHEPVKKTEKLVTDYIDNCEQSFRTLECLIQLNQNGVAKCLEWAEKFENEINSLRGQIEGLADHIEKVHDLVNLEDRITSSDVLNRLTSLETRKNYQTEENRKVSKRLNEISNYIARFEDDIHDLQVFKSAKLNTPHKCPICYGLGGTKISGTVDQRCNSCEGKGVIWG